MKSEQKTPPEDYLKYWRVIRYYMKAKHAISQAELDMILFLYSEKYFSSDKFEEFNSLLSWDDKRFKKLRRDGWIEVFRKRAGKRRALYQLSYKSTRMCLDIYRKLNGEEVPTSLSGNGMFAKNVCFTDKVYRNMIIEMNAYQREHKYKKPIEEADDL